MNVIKSVKPIGNQPVYDISVADVAHYVLENGSVTHNTGIYYSADNIWIIGRQQDKDGKELFGYNFVINIEKSRYVKEKSKIPISVSFAGGINRWSGMLDLAQEAGIIVKPKMGWYALGNSDGEVLSKNYREGELIDNGEFWTKVLAETNLADFIKNKYTLGSGKMIRSDEDIDVPSEAYPDDDED